MNYFNGYFESPELDTFRYARLFNDCHRDFDRDDGYCSSLYRYMKHVSINDDVRAISDDLRRAMVRYADHYR